MNEFAFDGVSQVLVIGGCFAVGCPLACSASLYLHQPVYLEDCPFKDSSGNRIL